MTATEPAGSVVAAKAPKARTSATPCDPEHDQEHRPHRPQGLAGGGAEVKSYSSAGQSILLLGVIPAYAWLASRLPRRQLINYISIFFIACLGLFYLLSLAQVPLGVVFYLWVGIFNLMVIEVPNN